MAVIGFCEVCHNRDGGCDFCQPTPQELLQLRHDSLKDLADGADNVTDLVAERAARDGIYRSNDPRDPDNNRSREVDADCADCGKRTVIDTGGAGYFCLSCGKEQPWEMTQCVYCELPSAVKRIDSHVCILCTREQPSESNVLDFN